jgi:SulP family sulfate permease
MLALSAVGTGLIVLTLGLLRWGRVVRLLPYPVAGGFLAGSGYLVLAGAFKVLTGQSLSWNGLGGLQVTALGWSTALAVALALLVLPKLIRHVLLVPGIIVAGIALFYVVLFLAGGDVETARAQGLLIRASTAPHPCPCPFRPGRLGLRRWEGEAYGYGRGGHRHHLFNAVGLSLPRGADRPDREPRQRLANLASGLAGMVGHLSVSQPLNFQAVPSAQGGAYVPGASVAFGSPRGYPRSPRSGLACRRSGPSPSSGNTGTPTSAAAASTGSSWVSCC